MLALQANAETPREFADRFYRSYFRWQIRGVPTAEERNRISPFFGTEILRLWAAADRQRVEFDDRFPIDPKQPLLIVKPPWCKEGDPFSNTWEGISTFAIGRRTRIRGRVAVEAHLEYIENGKTYPWTDTLVLDRAGDDWVVADICFANGESLVADMRKQLGVNERDLSYGAK